MTGANRRFDAWVKWLERERRKAGTPLTAEALGAELGCTGVYVAMLRRGERVVTVVEIAQRIEDNSSGWPDGPIRVAEWAAALPSFRRKQARSARAS